MAKTLQTVSIDDYAGETKAHKTSVIRATASPLTQTASAKSKSNSSNSISAASKKAKAGSKKHSRTNDDHPASSANTAQAAGAAMSSTGPYYVPEQQLAAENTPAGKITRANVEPTMSLDLAASDISVNIVSSGSKAGNNAQQRVARVPDTGVRAQPQMQPQPVLSDTEGAAQVLAQLVPPLEAGHVRMGEDAGERGVGRTAQLPAQFQTQTPGLSLLGGSTRQSMMQSSAQSPIQSIMQSSVQSFVQSPMQSMIQSSAQSPMQSSMQSLGLSPVQSLARGVQTATQAPLSVVASQLASSVIPHAMANSFSRPVMSAATPAATDQTAHASILSSSGARVVQTLSAVQTSSAVQMSSAAQISSAAQQQQHSSTVQMSSTASQPPLTAQTPARTSSAAATPTSASVKPSASVGASERLAETSSRSGKSVLSDAPSNDTHAHDAPNTQGQRLSDGFIVLISIAIMFVCALLFYFYMRQRRRRARRQQRRAHGGSPLHSASSLPSLLPGSPGGDKFRGLTRDSGTSLSLREPRGKEKLFPVMAPTDAHSVDALGRQYFSYRSGRSAERGAPGEMVQSLVDARHARFGQERRVVGAISFDAVASVRARLPPSPLQQQHRALQDEERLTVTTTAAAATAASGGCSQRSLLDTSAANPSLPAGSRPRRLRDAWRSPGSPGSPASPEQTGGKPNAGVKGLLRSLTPGGGTPASASRSPDPADDRASPLLESIESISDSYQFAVRHRPPLGPLRVVEPHVPGLPDELAVDRGHHMFVVGEFADGWVLAVNISRNSECGMIPRRCLFFPTAAFMTPDAVAASA